MKRPTMLFQALLAQASIELGVSTERDLRTIEDRFEHEGLSFLTITLPRLSDALERGIESGRFTLPLGFAKWKGRLPALLRGFFNRVFDEGGFLLSCPCEESILWIRQIARFFKKPKLSCSPAREAKAVIKYKQVEEDLFHAQTAVTRPDELLDTVSAILWSSVFPTVDPDDIVCRHGPGVTADRRLSNERRRIRFWYARAEGSLSAADHAFHNWNAALGGEEAGQGIGGIDFIRLRDEPGVRVVFVPKTLTTPRVIAIEPSSMQFMQQGVSQFMVATLERHNLTCGSVNFTDQTINQKLAYSASIDRRLATVDLSDASDRVHHLLVRRIFQRSPLLDYLEDCRSLHADLPDGSNIILKKYASMGSALCFPVEACVFYTLILTAIFRATGQRPNYRSIRALKKSVKVYGDDLIVPVEHVDAVCDYLESYALRVNRHKTFSASAFRESCGSDFYNGYAVNPVYARMDVPERRSEWTPSHIMSWTATANMFYERGWWVVAQCIRDMVASTVVTQIPISRHYHEGICFASCFQERNLVYDKNVQGWKQRRIVFSPVKTKDKIDGDYNACFNLAFERTQERGGLQSVGSFLGRVYSDLSRSGHAHQSKQIFSGWSRGAPDLRSGEHPNGSSTGNHPSDSRIRRPSFCGRNLFRQTPDTRQRLRDDHRTNDCSGRGIEVGGNFEIDFHHTVKRGVFTLKRRWVTLVT